MDLPCARTIFYTLISHLTCGVCGLSLIIVSSCKTRGSISSLAHAFLFEPSLYWRFQPSTWTLMASGVIAFICTLTVWLSVVLPTALMTACRWRSPITRWLETSSPWTTTAWAIMRIGLCAGWPWKACSTMTSPVPVMWWESQSLNLAFICAPFHLSPLMFAKPHSVYILLLTLHSSSKVFVVLLNARLRVASIIKCLSCDKAHISWQLCSFPAFHTLWSHYIMNLFTLTCSYMLWHVSEWHIISVVTVLSLCVFRFTFSFFFYSNMYNNLFVQTITTKMEKRSKASNKLLLLQSFRKPLQGLIGTDEKQKYFRKAFSEYLRVTCNINNTWMCITVWIHCSGEKLVHLV